MHYALWLHYENIYFLSIFLAGDFVNSTQGTFSIEKWAKDYFMKGNKGRDFLS